MPDISLKTRLMQRCFDLALRGAGNVSPNPMVGAVIEYQGRIIGEGYYKQDGGPHAEVMAVASVKAEDRSLLKSSTIYISLEPCNIHGRTPPCTDLLLQEQIPHVVVAARDLTPGVNGTGLDRLRAAGVTVEEAVLSDTGQQLSRYRNVFVSQQRPYVVLKYAQTTNGYLAPKETQQKWLTNGYSKRLVHRWRTQTDAILVGSGTALADDPALTPRLHPGPPPIRVVIDRSDKLPGSLKLFDGQVPTWIFSEKEVHPKHNISPIQHNFSTSDWLQALLRKLAERRIAHLTVEGGAWLLAQFIKHNCWDEARVFTAPISWTDGKNAPTLPVAKSQKWMLAQDELAIYYNK